MLVSGSVCRWRWHVAISHCLLDTCIVCLQKYLEQTLLSEAFFLTGTRVRRGPVRVGIRIAYLIIIWLDLNWLERHYVSIWHRCKCSEVCCFRTLNRWRMTRRDVEKSIDAFATWVSRSHERTQPAGNVQVSNAAEVRHDQSFLWGKFLEAKMMGFLEVLLQLMITSQCFF